MSASRESPEQLLLKHEDLEQLMGPVQYTVIQARAQKQKRESEIRQQQIEAIPQLVDVDEVKQYAKKLKEDAMNALGTKIEETKIEETKAVRQSPVDNGEGEGDGEGEDDGEGRDGGNGDVIVVDDSEENGTVVEGEDAE
jgi:hypothetical protein